MNAAEQYVAAAYLVVFVLVLTYVLIIAAKLQRLERALDHLSSTSATPDESALKEQARPAASVRRQRGGVEPQTR